MKIGFDIDEVLLDTIPAFLDYHNPKLGTDFKKEDIFTYDLWEIIGCSREEAIGLFREFFFSGHEIKPVEGAIEAVDYLSRSHELYNITSRDIMLKDLTHACIDKYFPNKFKEIHFTNQWGTGKSTTKGIICSEQKIDVLIEDGLHYAREVSQLGIRVLLYDCPWNQEEVNGYIKRVRNWPEIVDYLR